MKKLLILLILTLLAMPVFAQSPPTEIAAGVIVRNGGNTTWGTQFTKDILSVITSKNEAGEVDKRLYTEMSVIYTDDIYMTEGQAKELESIAAYAMVEKPYKKFTFAMGAGIMDIEKSGDNDYKIPILLKASYVIFNSYTIGIHAQLIPSLDAPDMIFTGLSIGFLK